MSAGITALIAIAFWAKKKKRELQHDADKVHQKLAIEEKYAVERRRQQAREHQRTLEYKKEGFAQAAKNVLPPEEDRALDKCWASYLRWLEYRDLHNIPANVKTIQNGWHPVSDPGGNRLTNLRESRDKMAATIRSTVLPDPDA